MIPSTQITLYGDGLNLSPAETAAELARLTAELVLEPDVYGLGGVVEEVETFFARQLGKERALFMPTGTLANHLAVRALAGESRRVIVQDISHIYNDTGDGCQTLSGLTLLPMAPGKASFTWQDVEAVLDRTGSGRVAASVGVISIESPVRRFAGELFDRAQMLDICQKARERGIRTHLDGARMYIASAYTGIAPDEYAAPFDTVYVSLWKYFNSLNGAILAGPADVLDDMFHTRRMFGGALFNAWPFAVLARHYASAYLDHMKNAIAVSEQFIKDVDGTDMRVERVRNGTNIFRLIVPAQRAVKLRERLAQQQVMLPQPAQESSGAVFWLQVNETWNRTTAARLAEQFNSALR